MDVVDRSKMNDLIEKKRKMFVDTSEMRHKISAHHNHKNKKPKQAKTQVYLNYSYINIP